MPEDLHYSHYGKNPELSQDYPRTIPGPSQNGCLREFPISHSKDIKKLLNPRTIGPFLH